MTGSRAAQLLELLLARERVALSPAERGALVQRTRGYSGADLAALCTEAALAPLRELPPAALASARADALRPIAMSDLVAALASVAPRPRPWSHSRPRPCSPARPAPPRACTGRGGAERGGAGRARCGRVWTAPPPPRTKWTRRVPHPVLIGHAASLSQVRASVDRASLRALEEWNGLYGAYPAPPAD